MALGIGQQKRPRRQPSAPFIAWICPLTAPTGDIINST